MILNLGEVAICRGCPICISSTLPPHHPVVGDQLVKGYVLTCVCWLSYTGFGTVYFLLLISSLGAVGLVTCISFLVGGPGACPLVDGVGFDPPMGRAMLRCGFGLRRSLRSLYADGWDFVPSLSCLVWGIPALEPTGCWVGPDLGGNIPSKLSAFRWIFSDIFTYLLSFIS